MKEPIDNSALSPEQQDTARLIDRLLGQTIAARYEDFCRLSAGAFSLNATKPIAAHVLRELESTLRGILAVPMQAVAVTAPDFDGKTKSARRKLKSLGFENEAINRAIRSLEPRTSHRTQIQTIVSQLGLDKNGDIASQWIALTASVGLAHNRSFHDSMRMDDKFNTGFAQPFHTVVRAVVVALQNRYAALMRRVEELAVSRDYAKAVKAFKQEIPGAKPLQWHFFQHLVDGEWLSHLIKEGLVVEPLVPLEGIKAEQNFGAWPLGNYLYQRP